MMAKSFRSVGWVASVAAAALGCYLISQRVAGERNQLEKVENRILQTKLDIRKLQTELNTRGRMGELERWNSEVLALSAPVAGQYLQSDLQLVRFTVQAKPEQPAIQPVAYRAEPAPTVRAPEVVPVAPAAPMLRHANYIRPADGAAAESARKVALLDDNVLDAIGRTADGEGRGKNNGQ